MPKAIPDGYHSITPYLIVDGAARALDWYAAAFGAKEVLRLPMGDKVAHAEIQLGDSKVMLSDEWPELGLLGAGKRGGATASLMFYVENVDQAFERAVKAGATVEREVADQFYGDRSGTLIDPFGCRWTLGTHVEDVPEDELARRMEAWGRENAAA